VSKNALGVLSASFNTLAETVQTEWRNKETISRLLAGKNVELELQKKALDNANRLQRSFFSHMSHELRTPLNAVINLAGILSRRLAKTISREEAGYLEIIERNGRELLTQINDILDWSRFAAGRMEVNVKPFFLQTCIAEIVTMLEPQAREKGLTLENRVGNELPILNSDTYICRHILENLLGNALKFTESGQVEVTARLEQGMIYVAIRDTGIGISSENLANVFEEYHQGDNGIFSKYGGSGLGLAIAKKYAGLLQGSLSAESTLGVGSTFTLRLPLNFLTLGAGPENEVNHGNE
jgi:signal transduction histidine kinase